MTWNMNRHCYATFVLIVALAVPGVSSASGPPTPPQLSVKVNVVVDTVSWLACTGTLIRVDILKGKVSPPSTRTGSIMWVSQNASPGPSRVSNTEERQLGLKHLKNSGGPGNQFVREVDTQFNVQWYESEITSGTCQVWYRKTNGVTDPNSLIAHTAEGTIDGDHVCRITLH